MPRSHPTMWKPAALLLVVLAFSGVAMASHGGGIGDVPFSDLLEGRLGVDTGSGLSNLSGTEKLLFGIVIPFLLVFILFFELLDKIEVLSRQSTIAVAVLLSVSLLATPTYPRIATFFLGTVLPLMTQSMLGIAAVGIILFLVMLGLSGRGSAEGAGGLLSGNKTLLIWIVLGVGAFVIYGGLQNVLLVISILIMALIAIVGFYVIVGEEGGGAAEMGVEEAIIFTVIMVGLMLYTFFEVPFMNEGHKGGALGMVLVIILILIIGAAIIEARGEESFLGGLVG